MLKQGAQMITGPVELTMTAYMPIPASYSEKRKRDLRLKPHTSRPDVDNVLKAVLDGVSGVAYADDKHVVAIHARKVYGEMPGLHVELKEIVEV
jgi:Holliday junction resolvase RusA-like endonuclease